jgi:hypothetical protein
MVAAFEWTTKKETAALSLAKGETQKEAAAKAGIAERTLRYWLDVPEFSEEVDRLSLMIETASRAYRLRLTNRVIHQMVKDGELIKTEKDLLDWLKYAQSETDGAKTAIEHDMIFKVIYGSDGTDNQAP